MAPPAWSSRVFFPQFECNFFGHLGLWHGGLDAEEAIYERANRLCAASGGDRNAGRRDLSQFKATLWTGIAPATFYAWRKKCAGLMPSEMKRLKQLDEKNAKLKRLVADLSLDKAILQDVIKRKL